MVFFRVHGYLLSLRIFESHIDRTKGLGLSGSLILIQVTKYSGHTGVSPQGRGGANGSGIPARFGVLLAGKALYNAYESVTVVETRPGPYGSLCSEASSFYIYILL